MGWAIASGIAIAALGIFSLAGGRSRTRGAVPFGLFGLTWGIQITTIGAGSLVGSEALATKFFIISMGAGALLPFTLVEFAGAHARRGTDGRLWQTGRILAGALALIGGILLVIWPETIIRGAVGEAGRFFPHGGSLELWLIGVPRVLAFGLAVIVLDRAVRAAPTGRTRNRTATLLAGIVVYVSYAAARNTMVHWELFTRYGSLQAIVFLIGFAGLALLVVSLAARCLYRTHSAVTADDTQREQWLATAYLAPFLVGLGENAVVSLSAPGTVGLWRLLGVGIIAYGLARWRVHDLRDRLQHVTSSATGAVGAAAGGATAYGAAALTVGGTLVPLLGALVVTGLSLIPGVRWARKLLGPSEPEDPVEQDQRDFENRVEAYRAALEASMARGTMEEDERFLASLRERFGITDAEDRIVRYYARQAVVPVREGDPEAAYERLRILGEGGAGRTWLARDRARERLVVLKEPLERWQREPAVLEAARREARLAARVRHPNVVEVEEVVEHGDQPILVLEHVAGGSLADRLRSKGVLEWRRALSIAHGVAQGLSAIHNAGIVHRDVKPSNILLGREGIAKVTDFGIAREAGDGRTKVEEGASSLGTDAYMAPEVRRGSSSGDERSDVYGCAAVLYTCLHGAPPSDGGPVIIDNEVPPQLERVLAKGLAVDPDDRYQDATELAEALAEVVTQ